METGDNDAEAENQEPQITSEDPNERKLARKIRINRRTEALKKSKHLEGEEQIEVPKKSQTEKQIESSWALVEKLILEGDELVTNIRIANDAREVKRRQKDAVDRQKIIEKLEAEADQAMGMFNAINEKWSPLMISNDPLDIHYGMLQQKAKCEELFNQKNGIINDLKDELKKQDLIFDTDQRKQMADLTVLCQRIDKQIILMRNVYRNELKLLEDVIMAQRRELNESNNKKWESLYKQRDKDEEIYMIKKLDQTETFEKIMDKQTIDHHEKFRAIKIQLEMDTQILQQELRQLRSMCLINTEKLFYNYQVLKSREDENIIIKSQQKKRMNKLQDTINDLKKQMFDYDESSHLEITKLTNEVLKLHDSILDIESKADHFSEINDRKYRQIWDMNRKEAVKLLNNILDVDRVLYEQQLGVKWEPPSKSLPYKEELPSYKSANLMMSDAKKTHSNVSRVQSSEGIKNDRDKEYAKKTLLRRLLCHVADRSGFLLESKLIKMLRPYTDDQKTLIKLDNVFTALDVSSQDDIEILLEFFLPYVYCPICDSSEHNDTIDSVSMHELAVSATSKQEVLVESFDSESPTHRHLLLTNMMSSVHQPPEVVENILATVTEKSIEPSVNTEFEDVYSDSYIDLSSSDSSDSQYSELVANIRPTTTEVVQATSCNVNTQLVHESAPPMRCPLNHTLSVNPAYVLKALKEFAAHTNAHKTSVIKTMTTRLANKRCTVARLVVQEDVTAFWERFREMFPREKEQVWDALLAGLKKYYDILRDRHKLNLETQQLRKQNVELRRLLRNVGGTVESYELLPPVGSISSIQTATTMTQNARNYSSKYLSQFRPSF